MEAIATGIALFDSWPARFRQGRSHMAFGARGTGKSTLGLQFAYAGLGAGETVLYVCRERAEDLLELGKGLGFALDPYLDDDRLVLLQYDDQIQEIVTQRGFASVLEELCGEIEQRKIRRVILDPIDPFLSACSQEAEFRSQLRTISSRFEEIGWTSLLFASDAVARQPFALGLFSELCWGVFELRQDTGKNGQTTRWIHLHRMGDAELTQSQFAFRIDEGGVQIQASEPTGVAQPSFARFRRGAERGATEPILEPQIPEVERAAAAKASTGRGAGRARHSGTSSRALVLVVDDDSKVRIKVAQVMNQVAQVLGFQIRVAEAADGIQALRSAVAAKPDLVVSGVSMPRLDGIGLCRLLREHGADVPVLFLASRRSSAGERLRCFMVGGDEIVAKPFEPNELAGRVAEILRTRPPGSAIWPAINLKTARSKLGPRRIEPDHLGAHIALGVKHAREGNVGLYLVGYEFRFVDGNEGSAFVDRFFEGLCQQIRAEDALCPMSGPRIVVLLVDADEEIVRGVLGRIHERMVVEAAVALAGRRRVKPKALYRLLALSPPTVGCEVADGRFVETLFARPARLIEEDLQGRPGEPVEKYPLLESVYAALTRGDTHCASPRDGTSHELTYDPRTGVRSVVIGEYRYRTQDPNEESPAGTRAGRGAQLVWVEEDSDHHGPIARIEDGRVFRDDDV